MICAAWILGCPPGTESPVATLETRAGPIATGAMICYDREFPETARILMLNGAELLLVPNACDLDLNRTTQLRARAFENMVAIALANYAGEPCLGRSLAFDGIAYAAPDGPARDMLIAEGGEGDEVVLASLDVGALRRYRTLETWGNAYRQPRLYGALTATEVCAPFVRSTARR